MLWPARTSCELRHSVATTRPRPLSDGLSDMPSNSAAGLLRRSGPADRTTRPGGTASHGSDRSPRKLAVVNTRSMGWRDETRSLTRCVRGGRRRCLYAGQRFRCPKEQAEDRLNMHEHSSYMPVEMHQPTLIVGEVQGGQIRGSGVRQPSESVGGRGRDMLTSEHTNRRTVTEHTLETRRGVEGVTSSRSESGVHGDGEVRALRLNMECNEREEHQP